MTYAADLGYMAPRMTFCPYLRQLSPSSRGAMSCTAATRTCALTHGVPFLRQQTERASEHMSGRRTLLLDATNDETKSVDRSTCLLLDWALQPPAPAAGCGAPSLRGLPSRDPGESQPQALAMRMDLSTDDASSPQSSLAAAGRSWSMRASSSLTMACTCASSEASARFSPPPPHPSISSHLTSGNLPLGR